MSVQRRIRRLTQVFEGEGCSVVTITQGKHFKFHLDHRGRRFFLTVSVTPRREVDDQKQIATLRRIIRNLPHVTAAE